MGQNANIPNFANVNLFKVQVGDAAFVVPDTIQQASPSGISSGLSPATIFDTKRLGVGGYIFAAFADTAGPSTPDFQYHLNPGDSISVTFGSGNVTVTITSVTGVVTIATVFPATATGGVLAYYS